MMYIYLNVIAVLNIDAVNYCCAFNGISKSEAKNSLENANLNKKNGSLWNIIFYYWILRKDTKLITLGSIKTEKRTFHYHKDFFQKM